MLYFAPTEDVDINVIMKRFGVKDGSIIPRWANAKAIYGDFSNIPDNAVEVAEILRVGELSFKTLPADIRNRFQSGAKLYEWLGDPTHAEEAVQLGLLKKRPPAPMTPEDMTSRLEKALVSINTSSDKE